MKQVEGWWIPKDDRLIHDWIAEHRRGFQVERLQQFLDKVPGRRVAIDGGAHIGCWTVELAQHFDHVYAFEPHHETMLALVCNLAERGLLEKVTWIEAAVSNRVGRGSMTWTGKDRDRGNTGGRYVTSGGNVEITTIDHYPLMFQRNDVDFIKLDLEGGEYYALEGASNLLERNKPAVMIEEKKGFNQRYGLQDGAAGDLLRLYGYREVDRIGADKLFL